MSTVKRKKLKEVLDAVPAGYLVDAPWLVSHGLAYETFRDYVKRGWLERVSRGVFRRPAPNSSPGTPVDWQACVLSMQHIMGYGLHVGGTTALARQGYVHYLGLGGEPPVWIYGEAIPAWLSRLPLNAPVKTRTTSLFAGAPAGLAMGNTEEALPWGWKLGMSTPERAILEALDELPDREGFHNLDMVFEGLTTLRPKRLSALLHRCRKIKVKRLFFVFADRHGHPWRQRLDPAEFNLGSGDRALVKGGRMHPRYRIMVPETLVAPLLKDAG